MDGIKGQRPKNRTSIVITSWKNQEFSVTSRGSNLLLWYLLYSVYFLAVRFWRFKFLVCGLFLGVGIRDCPQEVFLLSFYAATSEGTFCIVLSAFLCESRNLSSRPRLPTCSLLGGFHALVNKSTELLLQIRRKVRGRRLQDHLRRVRRLSGCLRARTRSRSSWTATRGGNRGIGHAIFFIIFPVAGSSREGGFQAVEFRVAPGSRFLWGWFRAALITRATDLRIIPPALSKGWSLSLREEAFSKMPVG